MDSNLVHGDIKKISEFNSKMNKNSRNIQNLANESLDKIYKIKNELSDRIYSLSSEVDSLEEDLDSAYRALDYAVEANSNSENPQPIPDYYYTRIDDISRRLREAKNELTQLEQINDEFQESIDIPLKRVEEATGVCVSKIGRGSDFIGRYIGKLEELEKATVGHSGTDGIGGYSSSVEGSSSCSIDLLAGLATAAGSSIAVEQMLSELGSYHDVVDYDAKENVSNLLAEFNISDDEPVSQNQDTYVSNGGDSSESGVNGIQNNSVIHSDDTASNSGTVQPATSAVSGNVSGPHQNGMSTGSIGTSGGTVLSYFNDTKFLAFKATMGNFDCKETVDDVEKYGVLSFGCDSKAADEWGNQNYDKWMRENSVIEDDIRFYTGTGYSAIRGYLDGTGKFSSEIARIERNLHAGLHDASLPNDIIIYRAISADALKKMVREAGLNETFGNGFILHDNSYISCSAVANNNFNISSSNKVIFRIVAQKGQHAAYVNKWSSVPINEYEILVDKDSYIYVRNCYYAPRKAITGAEIDEDIVLIIDGELIQK